MFLIPWCVAVALSAPVPVLIPVQGSLTQNDGAPLEGTHAIDLAVWADAGASSPLHDETLEVAFVGGAFSAMLGDAEEFDATLLRDDPTPWLSMRLSGGAWSARVPVGATPVAGFALLAGDAATLDGHVPADFRAADWLPSQSELTGVLGGAYRPGNWLPSLSELTLILGSTYRPATWTPGWADLAGAPVDSAALTTRVQALIAGSSLSGDYLPLTGGALTGAVTAPANGLAVGGTQLALANGNVGVGVSPAATDAKLRVNGSIQIGNGGATCGTANAGAIRFTGTAFEGCDGLQWLSLGSRADGSTAASAARTCKTLRADYPSLPDGPYYIDPDLGDTANAVRAYCLMSKAGGGWTKVLQYDNSTSLATSAAVNAGGAWVSGASGSGKLADAVMTQLWARKTFLMRTASPSDGVFLANGAGYLLWTANGTNQWSEFGSSVRPGFSHTLSCERTGDDVVDESQTYTQDTRATCPYGTYWLYDHNYTGSSQCYGFGTATFQSNLHFCGNGGTPSGSGVTGVTQVYYRD